MKSQRGLSGSVRRTKRTAEPEHRAHDEADPPSEVGGHDVGIEQDQGGGRAGRCAEPVRAVDDEVDRAADTSRDSSSIAELMAAYSPPIPMPVKNRKVKNIHALCDVAVSTVANR